MNQKTLLKNSLDSSRISKCKLGHTLSPSRRKKKPAFAQSAGLMNETGHTPPGP
jgi:hypothetical protein